MHDPPLCCSLDRHKDVRKVFSIKNKRKLKKKSVRRSLRFQDAAQNGDDDYEPGVVYFDDGTSMDIETYRDAVVRRALLHAI